MFLTRQEEEQLIQKYDDYIWNVVHGFKRRMSSECSDQDDLRQESVIAFLKYVRACEKPEDINRLPYRDMLNAMCRYVLAQRVVTYPQRTTDFSKTIKSAAKAAEYSDLDKDSRYRDMSQDDVLGVISLDTYIGSLPATERELVTLKLNGCTNRQASKALGISDVRVTRALKKIKSDYERYAA